MQDLQYIRAGSIEKVVSRQSISRGIRFHILQGNNGIVPLRLSGSDPTKSNALASLSSSGPFSSVPASVRFHLSWKPWRFLDRLGQVHKVGQESADRTTHHIVVPCNGFDGSPRV